MHELQQALVHLLRVCSAASDPGRKWAGVDHVENPPNRKQSTFQKRLKQQRNQLISALIPRTTGYWEETRSSLPLISGKGLEGTMRINSQKTLVNCKAATCSPHTPPTRNLPEAFRQSGKRPALSQLRWEMKRAWTNARV